MNNKSHNWKKEQPHHVVNGKITTKKFAENNPQKVEWVKVKNTKKK